MIKLFRLFFSKKNLFLYSTTLILTFLLGLANVYNINQQSTDFSRAFLLFSLMIYFLLFFVLESNRIYQFFRTADFRLLPISTSRLYVYNLIFSMLVGIIFFIGNVIIGVMINYLALKIPFILDATWIEVVAAVIDSVVLFLVVQFLVCIYSAMNQFVQKRFRWVLEIVLFILFMILIDYLSGFDLGAAKGIVMTYFGLQHEVYFRMIVQLVTASLYFSLSIWVINRYVEAGD
ncbi:hypothetical protein A5819_003193 [Enterococcus sp. 7E2_DIV0204]|uniref:hypothetical protein n=1 Tax=unclassified Enterococcus TaxID=2608891 RepID=UPI000A359E25|nr:MULTISPECIES: hypothetical protein [unclassified Enterococcus]OTN86359.1 hypothetical protein A5819_003193 [Enterococcus sp. 7E2_DIV0204]OTP48448.1 hypothetical protein A5884_003111 [Enterococcus sp. 7D2_DIV0200]